MSVVLKPTVSNIINLWFGADTPLRQYRIRLNPDLWQACQAASQNTVTLSKLRRTSRFQKADRVAFAKAVQQELSRDKIHADGQTDCLVSS